MDFEKKQIAVIGGREADSKALAFAEEVGRLIANKGWQLICGGMGGVMEAACRGASREGGITVGILPTGGRGAANAHVRVAVSTGLGIARNSIIAHSADGAIAVAGSYGTLSEIAYFLQLGKPVVVLESRWDIPGSERCETPEEAISRIEELT